MSSLFGRSKSTSPNNPNSIPGYVPPEVNQASTNSALNPKTLQKQDSPEMAEDDDGVMIITTSKSREEQSPPSTSSIPTVNRPAPAIHASRLAQVAEISKTGRDIGEATVANVRKVAEDGPLSFRVLAFLGGALMMITSVLSALSDVLTFSVMSCLISVYTFLFGFFIVILEGKMFMPVRSIGGFQEKLFSWVKCLQFVWGRGLLYIFAGSLQMSEMNFVNMVSGGYMCFVGVISLLVGRSSSNKLAKLRKSIADEAVLQQKFKKHDKDMDNVLNLLEFQGFISDLGLMMDHNELVAAFSNIDHHDTGKISLEEFKTWWSGFESNAMVDSGTLV